MLEPDPIDAQIKAGLQLQARKFVEMIRKTKVAPADAALATGRPAMVLAEQLTNAVLAAA